MGRLEYKYLVSNDHLENLREYMAPYVSLDPYAARTGHGEYTVRSIYYDNINLDAYFNKLAGIKVRKKFRVRGYNTVPTDASVFLEIKRKNVSTISKNRAPMLYSDVLPLLRTGDFKKYVYNGNGATNPQEQARRFLFYYLQRDLRPAIKVCYEREPYVYKFNRSLRITCDKNVRSSLDTTMQDLGSDHGCVEILPGYFILEVKTYKPYPSWLQYLIADLQLQHQALSKYTMGIDVQRKLGRGIRNVKHRAVRTVKQPRTD
ncbi:MAG: hypothetical protein MAGBODY4_01620 [Candidatus Marinimicrobia bacterium]|nr:hypothetical protein [Candidatus Neomarinimicrobiota bacterium]